MTAHTDIINLLYPWGYLTLTAAFVVATLSTRTPKDPT